MSTPLPPQFAVALTGGGARAAYQVGCLRFIAREFPQFHPNIITGVSAGAINAAHLASSVRPMREAVERLRDLWLGLATDHVYRVDLGSLAGHVLGWAARMLSGGRHFGPRLRGMVDTTPLRQFLAQHLPHDSDGMLTNIANNIDQGALNAFAISTTCYATGRSITWVDGQQLMTWERPDRASMHTRMSLEHIMASAALPMFFPAVNVDGAWHGDGGIRLTAPLSPALHLGATKILAVSPRYMPPPDKVKPPRATAYPTPARIAGVLLNSVFLDMLDHDEMQMRRVNELLKHTPEEQRAGARPVDVLILRPSRDLGLLASQYEKQLPRYFRFFERGFGTREGRSADGLAMVIFEPAYLNQLMALGEQDAEARAGEIRAFLDNND